MSILSSKLMVYTKGGAHVGLLARSDFDRLACTVFPKEAGVTDHWEFVYPRDLQDGLVEVTRRDCLTNVSFVEGCGLWFGHHSNEDERSTAYKGKYRGKGRTSPSCTHIIYDYYDGRERFPGYDDLLEAVDRVDSANLSIDRVLHPNDWTLLGFTMDPRTGLGRFHDFRVSNYALMEGMTDWRRTEDIHEIMTEADVKERIELYWDQNGRFIDMVKARTTVENKIIIPDLRGVDPIYTGNQFLIYSLYPDTNISVWIVNGKGGKGCSAAVSYSILNRTCTIGVGALILKYGSSDHHVVGTCQFSDDIMEKKLEELLKDMKRLND